MQHSDHIPAQPRPRLSTMHTLSTFTTLYLALPVLATSKHLSLPLPFYVTCSMKRTIMIMVDSMCVASEKKIMSWKKSGGE